MARRLHWHRLRSRQHQVVLRQSPYLFQEAVQVAVEVAEAEIAVKAAAAAGLY